MKRNLKLKQLVISSIVIFGPLNLAIRETKAAFKANPNQVNKLNKSPLSQGINYKIILENLAVPEDLFLKAKSLLDAGEIKATSLINLKMNSSSIDGIKEDRYYFRQVGKENRIERLTSITVPTISDIDGNKVVTLFKKPSGEEKILVTNGLPIWINGKDIVQQHSKKAKLFDFPFDDDIEESAPVHLTGLNQNYNDIYSITSSDVNKNEKVESVIEGLKSGVSPILNPSGGAISKNKNKDKVSETKEVSYVNYPLKEEIKIIKKPESIIYTSGSKIPQDTYAVPSKASKTINLSSKLETISSENKLYDIPTSQKSKGLVVKTGKIQKVHKEINESIYDVPKNVTKHKTNLKEEPVYDLPLEKTKMKSRLNEEPIYAVPISEVNVSHGYKVQSGTKKIPPVPSKESLVTYLNEVKKREKQSAEKNKLALEMSTLTIRDSEKSNKIITSDIIGKNEGLTSPRRTRKQHLYENLKLINYIDMEEKEKPLLVLGRSKSERKSGDFSTRKIQLTRSKSDTGATENKREDTTQGRENAQTENKPGLYDYVKSLFRKGSGKKK